jgi:hypothetical protein
MPLRQLNGCLYHNPGPSVESRAVHGLAVGLFDLAAEIGARVRRSEGEIWQESRRASQGHGEPEGARRTPGNRRGLYSAGARPPDPRNGRDRESPVKGSMEG